jgi:hypothetical protein
VAQLDGYTHLRAKGSTEGNDRTWHRTVVSLTLT